MTLAPPELRWRLLGALRPVTLRTARAEGFACRVVTPKLLSTGRGRHATGVVNGSVFDLALSDYLEAKAWITGRQDPHVVDFCRSHLPAGGVAIDVGANVGFITVPLAHRARAVDARVVAVEPLPRNVRRLKRHVARAGLQSTVDIVSGAAGEAPGEAEITVDIGAGFSSNGTIRAPDGAPAAGIESARVRVHTLDAICEARGIGRIDVVKIDVEGFEPAVLRGARGLLARRAIRAGVLEINEPLLATRGWTRRSVLELMRELGLRPEPLRPGGDIESDADVAFRATVHASSR